MDPSLENLKSEGRVQIKSLRTFQGDVQEAISKNDHSSTSIFISEQKRKIERPELQNLGEKIEVRNRNFTLFGGALIVLGLITVITFYTIKSREKVEVKKGPDTIIAFSDQKEIPLENTNRGEILGKLVRIKKDWNAPVNSVLFLSPTLQNEELTIQKVMSLLSPNMPSQLIRSFDNKYMLGEYSFDTNELFLIVKIDDFTLAYPGMLRWEEKMMNDIGELFNSSEEINLSEDRKFKDEVLKNRDMRVLYNERGESLLLYSFVDRKTLVITKNQSIMSALIDKILIGNQVR